VSKIYRSMI